MSVEGMRVYGELRLTPDLEFEKRREDLVEDGTDVLERKRLELVLLEEVVEVLLEHLEDETRVVLVGEALVGPDEVEVVRRLLAESVEDGHFDLPLTRVAGVVLEDLYGDYLTGPLLPTLHHLPERPSAQELQHFVLRRRRVEDLVLHQLVVPFAVRRRTRLRRGRRHPDPGPSNTSSPHY